MAVLNQLQPSFNNGEISPLLYDRVDYQKFVSSVKSGKNMFVHPQGGMSNRAGTLMLGKVKGDDSYIAEEKVSLFCWNISGYNLYYTESSTPKEGDAVYKDYETTPSCKVISVDLNSVPNTIFIKDGSFNRNSIRYPGFDTERVVKKTKYITKNIRLIPFEFSNTETYMIEFGNGYCRFYTTNGYVIKEDGSPYEIASPFTTSDLDKIRYVQSGDVMYLAWGGKPKTLTRYGHTDWRFDDYDFKKGPLTEYKEGFEGSLSYNNQELFIKTTEEFEQSDIGEKFSTKAFFPTQSLSYRVSSKTIADNIKETVFYAGGKITLRTSGTWAGQIHLEESESGESGWKRVRTFSSTEASADGGSNFDFASDYTNDETFLRINLDDLLTFSSSGLNIQFNVEGFYKYVSFVVAEKTANYTYRVTLIEDNPLIIQYVSGIIYTGTVKARVQSVDGIWSADSFSVTNWTVKVGDTVKYNKQFTGIDGPGGKIAPFRQVAEAFRLAIGKDGSVQYFGGGLQDITIEDNKQDYSGKYISLRYQSLNSQGNYPSIDVTFGAYFSDVEALTQESSSEILKYLWQGDTFPTEVDLYQDRIIWATNNQLDATKISDYENFGVSPDVTEDDAISVIIKDKKINKINSAIAGSKLVVFTDSGNFIHNNDTFTPNSATFLKQGSTGGADVKPVIVRDNIIYVHPMKQAISDYAYSFETDGYAGQDITILANHLFENKKIKTLAYQQEPYSIIWVLQEEGTVLACTYLRQQQVIAWTPMDFGGKVISIGVLSDGSNQELYLAVQRKNGTFVEKMPTRLPVADPKDRFFVDCGRTYRGEPATVITGLEYLNGETVVALADGYVVKDLVVANGQITLPNAASVVTVGLPYESVFETLTFDVNNGDGSNLNRKKRVVAVSVRYYNSRGSKISVNGHREVNMLERKTSNDDTDISLRNGFYREILPSSHDEPTTVKIRQDEPLPITIISVIPELEYER